MELRFKSRSVWYVLLPLLGVLDSPVFGALSVDHKFPVRGSESGMPLRLPEFSGKIVGLDFFAYWCGPCLKSSSLVEAKIQQYYEHQGGNAMGILVNAIAVNIESKNSRRTGLSQVVDDFSGELLNGFETQGIPLIAVLDGTEAANNGFVVRSQHAGLESVEKVRSVIDTIGGAQLDESPTAPMDVDLVEVTPVEERMRRWTFDRNLSVNGEGLFTQDFQVTQWTVQYGHDDENTQWDLGLTYDTYDIDLYSPDPFFEAASSSSDRILAQLNATQPLHERVTWQGQAGYYDGFQNFRSLWLHDYYQQIGSLPFFGDYPDVSPRGYRLATQFRWEYLPATGYLEANFGYYEDWIAPSAEFERVTVLGRDVIDSFAYRLASENILSPRLRSLLELQMTDTVVREKRYGIQSSLNAALGDSWVLRTQGGWVTENPDFEAYFVGATLEHDLTESWLVSVFGRFYHDTGEIQNSLPASNAPPGLDSYQIGLGVRWIGERSSVKITGGPYFTRYETLDIEAPFFEDLYRSRDWAMFQFAYSLNF
ncbi:MAG: hypothetical protein M2R45_05415 [Verrucomicrobia subdivision 3 bacterium]|nr:hypothetical protein [Limisphaerales bacterium]MCS1414522.1 hypothetical protein [Limisphaerales bacterium]